MLLLTRARRESLYVLVVADQIEEDLFGHCVWRREWTAIFGLSNVKRD